MPETEMRYIGYEPVSVHPRQLSLLNKDCTCPEGGNCTRCRCCGDPGDCSECGDA